MIRCVYPLYHHINTHTARLLSYQANVRVKYIPERDNHEGSARPIVHSNEQSTPGPQTSSNAHFQQVNNTVILQFQSSPGRLSIETSTNPTSQCPSSSLSKPTSRKKSPLIEQASPVKQYCRARYVWTRRAYLALRPQHHWPSP